MSTESNAPPRIEPYYQTDPPGSELELSHADAELVQRGHSAKGKVRILQQWSPMSLHWEFIGTPLEPFVFGEVEIKAQTFTAAGRLISKGANLLTGFVQERVDRAVFHLANYHDIASRETYHELLVDGESRTEVSWSQVVLAGDGWRIAIQPYRKIREIRNRAAASQVVALTGVGEIRKENGSTFKKKHVKPLLEALRIFLSFAFAEWSPSLLVVGANETSDHAFELWSNHDIEPNYYLRGWVGERHGAYLTSAFPGFLKRWQEEAWREPLTLAVDWLIQTSRRSGGSAGAIALGQIPLEMLAWLVLAEDEKILEGKEFDALSAASKLQLLFSHCGIPFQVPDELPNLKLLSTFVERNKELTGPQLITRVRNTIIHPNKKNREELPAWERNYHSPARDVLWEVHELFRHYITLVLLSLIGYSGKYANRIAPKTPSELKWVPWAKPPESEPERPTAPAATS